MKILVTGASGFVGSVVALTLSGGHDVIRSDASGENVLPCDLRDRVAVRALVESFRPDCIVHCGAISGAMLVRDAASVFDVNTGGTLNIAEAARVGGVKRVVFASSISVYGRHATRSRVSETAPLLARDPYGASKIAAETLLRSYAGRDFDVLALRLSSVFGEGRAADCFIQRAVRSWREGRTIALAVRGLVPRQLMHVSDAARALAYAADAASPTQFAYNISGSSYLSESQLAAIIASHLGGPGIETNDDEPDEWPDGDIGPLNIEAARRDLGFAPRADLRTALDAYVRLLAA